MQKLLIILCFVIGPLMGIAQLITGKCTENDEGVPFVSLKVMNHEVMVGAGETDLDGEYKIINLTPGSYTMKVIWDSVIVVMEGVIVNPISPTEVDFNLEKSDSLNYIQPLRHKDGGASGATITKEDIAKMPSRAAVPIVNFIVGADETKKKRKKKKRHKE